MKFLNAAVLVFTFRNNQTLAFIEMHVKEKRVY